MRRIRTAGLLLALLLLVRCGVSLRQPVSSPASEVDVVRWALAPAPRSDVEAAPASVPTANSPQPISHQERVRQLVASLDGGFCKSPKQRQIQEQSLSKLLPLGASAYPIYEAILADPNSTISELLGLYELLGHLGEDRRQFAPFVARRLGDPDELMPCAPRWNDGTRCLVRTFLIEMLADIGNERHAWALLPSMNDNNDENMQFRAVKALAKIGGKRELDALTAWLALQNPNQPMVQAMWKIRNEMKARLTAAQPDVVTVGSSWRFAAEVQACSSNPIAARYARKCSGAMH
jgi:hypothetical protein